MKNEQEIWQADVNGQIYETSFEGLAQWINEGSLLPEDKVRRGNLRWVEAGKVSRLYGFFNAKELGVLPPPVLTSTTDQSIKQSFPAAAENVVISNIVPVDSADSVVAGKNERQLSPQPTDNFAPVGCAIHSDVPPVYICYSCGKVFCKACPHSYSSVKICPICGEMCESMNVVEGKQKRARADSEKLDFMDFANALALPFKFPASLFLGAVMFMFFTVGQSVSSVGGLFLSSASIFCALLANTLTFGILANTVENIAQGITDSDFMPKFDDFSIWDDVVHPFFLSIGVYIVSFGLVFILFAGSIWFGWNSISAAGSEKDSISSSLPVAGNDSKAAQQIPPINQPSSQLNQSKQFSPINIEGPELQRMQEMIKQSRAANLDSATEKISEDENAGYRQMGLIYLKTAGFSLIPMFFALLWGLFYFPAACAVAGYTRSFTAVINPLIGLDTIKHLGFDYVKIVLIMLILGVFTLIISLISEIIFSFLNLPLIGNLTATALASFFHFYLWIVFSIFLGFALYKNAGRLKLFPGNSPKK